MMNNRNWIGVALLMLSLNAVAADGIADCAGVTDIKGKSKTLNQGSTLMVSLLTLEKQGEANFKPAYATPASLCVLERFNVGDTPVTAVYSPFEAGEQTLHFRFTSGGEEAREILVLYDGMASFMAKKSVFFVVENREGKISWYEMYREQPSYAALKPLVTSILEGGAQPLARVYWPKGEKEPVIDAYDTKRLK